jgi:hypothetical protein
MFIVKELASACVYGKKSVINHIASFHRQTPPKNTTNDISIRNNYNFIDPIKVLK